MMYLLPLRTVRFLGWICAVVIGTGLQAQSSATSLKTRETISLVMNTPLAYRAPNPKCETQLCLSLKQLIDGATTSIDFALYGYSGQREILQSLLRAKKRGVIIRGVVDKTVEDKSYYADTAYLQSVLGNIRDDHLADKKTQQFLSEKRPYQNKRRKKCRVAGDYLGPLQCFEGKGYASKEPIRFNGNLMHNKFFVVDRRYVWTGSANVSDTGTGGYNANIVALIASPAVAQVYTAEFEQMFLSGKYHRAKTRFKKQTIELNVDGSNMAIYFSPQSYAVKRGVLPLLYQAQESIDVMVFFLTHNHIVKALAKARQRGVQVRVILDATGAANAYSKHDYLRKQGVQLKVESWGGKMHGKSAVVDGKHLVLGSMNWTKAGASRNDENTIIIRNAPDKAAQWQQFFELLWTSIPNKWLSATPHPESKDSMSSCTDGIDNDFNKIKDKAEAACR